MAHDRRAARLTKPGPISWIREARLLEEGYQRIAGVDEAGRGPLAGPVVAAAVVLRAEGPPAGLADSKQLSPGQRWLLFRALQQEAASIGVGLASPEEIDRLNILNASLLAMRRAVARLGPPPDLLLVDGNHPIPALECPQQTVVKGDALWPSIAAGSIVAKVVRDLIMDRLDCLFPGYDLAQNKGYPTPAHLRALMEQGPSPVHRRSFAPVRAAWENRHGVRLAFLEASGSTPPPARPPG